jgi:hypothetical protein
LGGKSTPLDEFGFDWKKEKGKEVWRICWW